MRNFDSLSEREMLALAISLEEEDERAYADYADGLRRDFPASAEMFDGMRQEESSHRRQLIEIYQQRFGDHQVGLGGALVFLTGVLIGNA